MRLRRIGPYRLEGLLGRGGMGEVYRAWDVRLRRAVAIKQIRPERAANLEDRRRFRREARAAARLNHPNLVQVFDLLERDSGDWLVMELVEGEPLTGRIPPSGLGLMEALEIAQQVVEGLATAHQAGILHRDLKSQNVLVTAAGQAKIVDFGLALALDPNETTVSWEDELLGTVRAMSPEQVRERPLDARSDLFALGVLLFEMLTGRTPFAAPSAAETLRRVLTFEPDAVDEVRAEIPPGVAALVAALLHKDPARRPVSAAEVKGVLAAQREAMSAAAARVRRRRPRAEPPPTPPDERPTRFLRPRRGRRHAAGLHAVGLHAAGLALALAALSGLAVFVPDLLDRFRAPGEEGPNASPRSSAAPSRVVVGEPRHEPAAELELVASAALVASLRYLGTLPGMSAIDPRQIADPAATVTVIAQGVAADEVLDLSLEPVAPKLGRVTLRRIDGKRGATLYAESFDVPTDWDSLRLVDDAVTVHLARAWAGWPSRGAEGELAVRDDDYAAFLVLWRELFTDGAASRQRLARAEALVERSPRFPGARLVAAELAFALYVDGRRETDLARGLELAAGAREISPWDHRARFLELRGAILGERWSAAETLLQDLERRLPGAEQPLLARADLLGRRGDLEGAVATLTLAAQRRSTWQVLYRLADLELQRGRVPEARRHLEALLARAPESPWGLGKLAELELRYGELPRAAALYLQLARQQPRRSVYTNLGLAAFLEGRYDDAVDSYRQALRFDPDHPTVLLNLAEAEAARGHLASARPLFERLRERLESAEVPLTAGDSMTLAQCLAHLGESAAAVELARQVAARHPESSEIAYQEAVVHALAGDVEAMREAARRARERGVQPRWFNIPAFERLRPDPP